MIGQFTLANVRGQVHRDGNWVQPDKAFQNFVEPVKIVVGAFFKKNGDADIWIEIVLGNIKNSPIKITSLDLGFESPEIKPRSAPTRYLGSSRKNSEGYLWEEASQDWQSMYEDFTPIDSTHDIFDLKFKYGDDRSRTFQYYLGSGDNHHAVISTPVRFTTDTALRTDADPEYVWRLSEFETLGGNSNPILLPSDDCRSKIEISQTDAEPIDTISLWVKWSDSSLTDVRDDVGFHFRYALNSSIGQISHIYPYYVLPEKALLMESHSETHVVEFYPKSTHWMFKEWEDLYGVNKAGTGRMTRSKAENESYVFNAGTFGFPGRRPRNTALRFLYVILAGIATQQFITQPSLQRLVIATITIVVLLALMYSTFHPRSFRLQDFL